MPRFENHIPPHNKYWQIELVGSLVITQWGRIGNSPQRNEKLYPSSYTARRAYDDLIHSKEAKGYELVENLSDREPYVLTTQDHESYDEEPLEAERLVSGPSGKLETPMLKAPWIPFSKRHDDAEKLKEKNEAEFRRKMLMDNPLV
jgi:predicted DNA-binding WGR domain protein